MILTVPRDESLWPTLGPQVCDFIEQNMVFGPGDLRGKPARLDDEKVALIYRMYEVYPRGHKFEGRRRFKRVGLSLRKGTAKTELAAWIAACELHPDAPVRCTGWSNDGEPIGGPVTDPYIPLVAYTEEQSEDLAYGALRIILELSALKDDFDIGLERILRKRGDGKAVALASAPDARDGARTTFQHFDEPLALDTPVPTSLGWKVLGDIAPGDSVYGRDGRPVLVVGVSDVKHGRPCYRVTFENGDSVVTDASHVWTAVEWCNRPAGERQVTTAQMFKRGTLMHYGLRWRLPRANGFDGAETDLPIDPYVLGLWLGDGSTDAGYINTGRDDYAALSSGILHTVSDDVRLGVVRWLPTGLRSKLRLAGLLGRKHIPEAYLFSSREQRTALLQGLMDSDGHAGTNGACTFVQKHRALCEQVALLVRSLGVSASVVESKDDRSRTGVMCKVHFSPDFAPFRLQRKVNAGAWHPRRCTTWPAIASIEPVASVPVRCIAVDSPDHLFLVGHGLHLTHNTHRFTLPRLVHAHQTMLANIPKRKLADAWTLETTTAPEPGTGSVAESTMDYARAVDEGRIEDPRLFFFHREASEQHDLTTDEGVRAAILEASGPVAEWSDLESIAEQWRNPKADLAYLSRVWLNRLVKGGSQAFDVERWKALKADYTVKPGALIALALDGAQFFDSTALVATEIETGYQWLAGLWERPYGVEEWQVPAEEVDAKVEATFKAFSVWRFYCDPPYWQSWIATWAAKYGTEKVIEWQTNRRRQMSSALENYETAITDGTLQHDGDPRFERHIGNARKKVLPQIGEDGRPLWLIEKERADSPYKIDAAVSGALSWECRTDAIAAGVLKKKKLAVYFMGGSHAPTTR